MSSKMTGEFRWARELTETTRAPPAARSAGSSPRARRKWPRWLVANCSSELRRGYLDLKVRYWSAREAGDLDKAAAVAEELGPIIRRMNPKDTA